MICSDLWERLSLFFFFSQVLKSIYYQAKNLYTCMLGQGLEKVFSFRAFHRSLTKDKLVRPQFLLGI